MIILFLLHLAQTYVYGAYKSGRELLWLAGCFLFLLVLGMGFTGYLLPWDRRAYFATAVGTNIISEVPLIGPFLKTILRGEGCSACHGAGGGGGEGLVKLWGMKDRFADAQLAELLRKPRPSMLEGGMEPSKLPDADLRALVA